MKDSRAVTLSRAHLLAELGADVAGLARLTVLSAPLGYGKSSLLDEWVGSLPPQIRVARVSAAGLSEAHELWKKLGEELAATSRDAEHRSSLELAPDRAVHQLLQASDTPTLLIIDDYENVASTALDEALLRLLEGRPNTYLAVAGRSFALLDTPLVYLRLPTRILRQADLSLSETEAADLFRRFSIPAGSAAEEMVRLLAGWPLATYLALENTKGDAKDILDLEALNEVVLEALPDPESRRILSLTTYLPGVSQKFLETERGVAPGTFGPLLHDLMGKGLVQELSGPTFPLYWAHPAMRAYPLWIGDFQMDARERREIRIEFATAIARSRPAESLRTFVDAEAFAEADEHALVSFAALISTPTDVLDTLRLIPDEILVAHTGLLALRMVLEKLLPDFDADQVTAWAQVIEEAILAPAGGDVTKIRSSHLTQLIMALRILGKWGEALEFSRHLELRLAHDSHRQYQGGWHGLPIMYSVLAVTANLAMYSNQTDFAQRLLAENLSPVIRLKLGRARLAVLREDFLLAVGLIGEPGQGSGAVTTMPEGLLLGAVAYYGLGDYSRAFVFLEELDKLALTGGARLSILATVPYDSLLQLSSLPAARDIKVLEGVSDIPERARFKRIQPPTPSESRVLKGIAHYRTVEGTANALHLSANTVKTHLRSVFAKLGVNRREDALKMAEALGWLKG